ncbi:DNA repair protein RecN [uncultured Clostridium sp.]|jgi:DNA repair protein RecN (Recombination protein N)|uniref:DNA repair protein RecN n=1 Tax=uncultured Clostridium sp. TaxID=59620 RepID=UPI00262F89AD|nr:DNA repair protein RecN [uncultured Clostridium sp.]
MLLQISIENFALIEKISLDFKEGFNILSGETGAGKSILIDSINYVLGSKFNKDLIRIGADKTFVEGVFSIDNNLKLKEVLEQLEIKFDDVLIISRESSNNGKNISKVNGKSLILSDIRRVTSRLVDIHGQHNNQNLLNKEMHIYYLDSFCDESFNKKLKKYQLEYENLKAINKKISELSKEGKNEKLIDYLEFQLKEIKSAELKVGEEEELRERFNILSNSEKIGRVLSSSYGKLDGDALNGQSIIECMSDINKELASVEIHSKKIEEINSRINSLYYELEELAREISDENSNINYNDAELDEINSRLYQIAAIERKYGESEEAVLNYARELEVQLSEMLDCEKIIEELKEKRKLQIIKLDKVAMEVHKIRSQAAILLRDSVKAEFAYIGLGKCIFEVSVTLTSEFNELGKDKVQFLISTNPGQPIKPMEKIVSGGELSRIMLAMKTVFIDKDNIPTVVFDEIDTGISGQIAQSVAEKMYEISLKHQVFCISHLPQIASMSDNHYFVSKDIKDDKTFSRVTKVDTEKKIIEIAKMLGGVKLTESTIANAREMVTLTEYKKIEIKDRITN